MELRGRGGDERRLRARMGPLEDNNDLLGQISRAKGVGGRARVDPACVAPGSDSSCQGEGGQDGVHR